METPSQPETNGCSIVASEILCITSGLILETSIGVWFFGFPRYVFLCFYTNACFFVRLSLLHPAKFHSDRETKTAQNRRERNQDRSDRPKGQHIGSCIIDCIIDLTVSRWKEIETFTGTPKSTHMDEGVGTPVRHLPRTHPWGPSGGDRFQPGACGPKLLPSTNCSKGHHMTTLRKP